MNNGRVIDFVFGAFCGTCTMGYLMYKEGKRHGDEMLAKGIDFGIALERFRNELESKKTEKE